MAFKITLAAVEIPHKRTIFYKGTDIILWTTGSFLHTSLQFVIKHLVLTTVAPYGIIDGIALGKSSTISRIGGIVPQLKICANLR